MNHSLRRPGFHLAMAISMAVLLIADAWLAILVHLSGIGEALDSLPGVCLLAALCGYCHWRKYSKLKEVAALAIWAVFATLTLSVLVQIAARSPAPLVDSALAQWDNAMGLSAADAVRWISRFPLLHELLTISYGLLPLMILTALFLPVLFGYPRDSRCYVAAIIVAAIITAVLFLKWPAAGPWTVYHFKPDQLQASVERYLHALKSSRPISIQGGNAGIVSFPSFHVVLALLSALALRKIPYIRWGAAGLSILICISTVTTGWHYFVDVLGGIAVTGVAVALVYAGVPRLSGRTSSSTLARAGDASAESALSPALSSEP